MAVVVVVSEKWLPFWEERVTKDELGQKPVSAKDRWAYQHREGHSLTKLDPVLEADLYHDEHPSTLLRT